MILVENLNGFVLGILRLSIKDVHHAFKWRDDAQFYCHQKHIFFWLQSYIY